MNRKTILFFFLLPALFLFQQCGTKTNAGKKDKDAIAADTITTATSFDTIIKQLKSKSELVKEDILELKVIDTAYSYASNETSYCDTTVQLNDSIFYTVIELSNQDGVCIHLFLVTIDEKNKKPIASHYLEPYYDVDYSQDSYDLYEYKIISKDRIRITKTTVFQKKNKPSKNEEENIDYKAEQTSFLGISSSGKIHLLN